MAETLKERTAKGIIWSFTDRFGQQAIYFISGIILARLLSPDDYGLVGGIAIFIALSNALSDSGFSRVLLNKQQPTQQDYSTVFYFNLFISILIYLLLFIAAPLIARFYGADQLIMLVRIQSLSIIFYAISIVQTILLLKKLDFKTSTRVGMISLTLSTIISLAMSYMGMGVWGLVAQQLLFVVFKSILFWTLSDWRPDRTFSFSVLKKFFSFANKIVAANLLNVFFNYIYYLIIGRCFKMTQLGYYTQANKYQEIPSGFVSNTFRVVVMPVLAEVRGDNTRLKRVVSKNFQLIAFTILPLMGILIVVAEPLFLVLFKEKWLPSVPLFRILCLGGIITPFTAVINELFISKERADIFLGVEVAKKIILVLLIVALFAFGLVGLAASWSIYSLLTLCISLYYSRKLIDYSLRDFIKDFGLYLLLTVIACATGWHLFITITNPFLFIILNTVWVGIIYSMGCYLFKAAALSEIIQLISKKRNKK